ncbi:hypothetical protein TRVA0_044S01068 [Trichomonascus vanleenenianus]|uniref:YidH family protein n=1 Tax=Trichomonascus vanleenenianus TaxID=2268995 RepID=UPI003ECABFEB
MVFGLRVSDLRTVELENTGATARDHLANERTFLAWLRTSLAFASIGVAVTQFFRLNIAQVAEDEQWFVRRLSTVLGSLFVGVGLIVIISGMVRYFYTQKLLQKGLFPVSRVIIMLSFLLTTALVVITFGVLIDLAGTGSKDYEASTDFIKAQIVL